MPTSSSIEPARSSGTIDPTILFDDDKFRLQLVVSERASEMLFMLETYKKRRGGLELVLERSVKLNDATARRLTDALRSHLFPTESSVASRYYVLKAKTNGIETDETDPRHIAEALSSLLADGKIAKHLADQELGTVLKESLAGAIRISELRSALAKLRKSLDDSIVEEKYYQKWCEEHTWAFGNAYVLKDSERRISPGDTLDLLLPTVLTGYREIIELKRPDMEVLIHDKSHHNYYFSQETSRAIGQCHRYIDRLHDEASRGLKDHPHIVAYHPRAIIVMGRSIDWLDEKMRALHCLNRGMHHITIMTYDHLLAQGERALQIIDYEKVKYSPIDLEDTQPASGINMIDIVEHAKPNF